MLSQWDEGTRSGMRPRLVEEHMNLINTHWRRVLFGLFILGSLVHLVLCFYPAPAGSRGSIDFDQDQCPRWLVVSALIRYFAIGILASGGILVAECARKRLWSLLILTAIGLFLVSGFWFHWVELCIS